MKNILIKKCLLNKNSLIHDAIINLTRSHQQIIFVIDNKKKFVGTIADGDIRRGFVNGLNLSDPITKIVNKNPKVLKKIIETEQIIKIMNRHNINHLPLLKNGIILSVYSLTDSINVIKKKNIFLIMAGGLGKRLYPLTKKNPKPMLKIYNKPMLEHLILAAKKHGFENIFISVHYLKNKIIKYFKDGSSLGVKISYIIEKKPLGTAGSIKFTKNSTLPILITNCDVVSNINYNDLMNFHLKNNADATMVIKYMEDVNPFGIVKVKKNLIVEVSLKKTN